MSLTKLAVVAATACHAAEQTATVNPIRKVVNMLQAMQKKVEAEGEKEKELFDKFMCYCKNLAASFLPAFQMRRTRCLPSLL
jgi:cytochrome c5